MLQEHLQSIVDLPPIAESMKLSVGGKTLKHPNSALSKSILTSHSFITCEYNLPLHGGMQKSSPKVQDQVKSQATNESNRQKIADDE